MKKDDELRDDPLPPPPPFPPLVRRIDRGEGEGEGRWAEEVVEMSIARWMEGRKGQREKEKERGRQSDRGSWFVGWLSEGSARPRDALDNKTQARWAS